MGWRDTIANIPKNRLGKISKIGLAEKESIEALVWINKLN
jgi:hypothetical protein